MQTCVFLSSVMIRKVRKYSRMLSLTNQSWVLFPPLALFSLSVLCYLPSFWLDFLFASISFFVPNYISHLFSTCSCSKNVFLVISCQSFVTRILPVYVNVLFWLHLQFAFVPILMPFQFVFLFLMLSSSRQRKIFSKHVFTFPHSQCLLLSLQFSCHLIMYFAVPIGLFCSYSFAAGLPEHLHIV